ncbi:MAG: choice-of-anchor B domain-containing protein [Flavobacteriaceae bacterium]|jgi:choice-of-anchor B domain-containing protein
MHHLIFYLLISSCSYGQGSKNTRLLDHWNQDTLVTSSFGVRYNECFGFVQSGKEYAIAGSTEGSHFFHLSADDKFVPTGFIEGKFNNAQVIHRDFARYQDYIYAVCDEGNSSLQIIDISNLPTSVSVVSENDSTFARVHNIFIDTANALLYASTITESVGGILQSQRSMQLFSLTDPLNPSLVYTGPSDIPEVHDSYVRNNIAYLNCGFDGLRVYDFSDPMNPVYLQNMNFYIDQGYNHQGALSPDGSLYVFADETQGKKIKLCTISDNQATIISDFSTNSENNSVPHNISITGDFAYVAYYNEGLRIYDLRTSPPIEIAYYDTYPIDESLFMMRGAWGVYTDYPSGRILVSDRVYGLFLIDVPQEILSINSSSPISIFPNPSAAGSQLQLALSNKSIDAFTVYIYDNLGKLVLNESRTGQTYAQIDHQLAVGAYQLKIQYTDYLGEQRYLFEKFIVE